MFFYICLQYETDGDWLLYFIPFEGLDIASFFFNTKLDKSGGLAALGAYLYITMTVLEAFPSLMEVHALCLCYSLVGRLPPRLCHSSSGKGAR